MPKKFSVWLIFFLTLVLVALERPAFAHDAPAITPTRLDFDASQAPKRCNDPATFDALLGNWVLKDALGAGDRVLRVRIRRAPTGGKLTDVTLVDAAGATLAEHHERFSVNSECHQVLYESARAAARLLGAFEPPRPPEPCPVCPACPACPSCPPPPVAEPARCPPCPTLKTPPIVRRAYFGAGVFLGVGLTHVPRFGPKVSLGFVPIASAPRVRVEIDGAWAPYASTTSNTLRGTMVPLFGSLCVAPAALRLCGGPVTTFFLSEHDAMHITLAASLRLGAEFEIAGPFSIRIDAFVLLPFWKRTFGHELGARDAEHSLAAGSSATGVWSF